MQFIFDNHTLDTDRRELRRGLEPIAVEPQVFDLLVYLVRNRDRLGSHNAFIEAQLSRGTAPAHHEDQCGHGEEPGDQQQPAPQ